MATVAEEARNLPDRFRNLSNDQKLAFVRAARNSGDANNFYTKMANPNLLQGWMKVNPPGAKKITKAPKAPPKERAKKRVAGQLPGGKKATKPETTQELAIEKAKYDARMADIQSRQGLGGGLSFDFTDALGSQSYENANPLFQQFVRLAALKGEFLAEMYVDPATIATGGGYTAVKAVGGANKVLKGMNIPGKAKDLYNKAGQYADEAGNLIFPTIGPQFATAGGVPMRQPRGSMFSVGGGGKKGRPISVSDPQFKGTLTRLDPKVSKTRPESVIPESPAIKADLDKPVTKRVKPAKADVSKAVRPDVKIPKANMPPRWDAPKPKETPAPTPAQEPLYALAAKSEEAIQAGKRLKELSKDLKVETKAKMFQNAADIKKEMEMLEGQIARGRVQAKQKSVLEKKQKAETKKMQSELKAQKKGLEKQLKNAVKKQNFDEALRLQKDLDKLERTGLSQRIDLKGSPATPKAKADAPAAPELDPQAESYLRMAGADAPKTPKAKADAPKTPKAKADAPETPKAKADTSQQMARSFIDDELGGKKSAAMLGAGALGTAGAMGYGVYSIAQQNLKDRGTGDTGEEEESITVEDKFKQYQTEDSSKARKTAAEKAPEMYEKTKTAETETPVEVKETATDYGLPIIEPRGIKFKMMRVDVADKLMTNQQLSQREQGFYNRHKKDIDKFIQAKK